MLRINVSGTESSASVLPDDLTDADLLLENKINSENQEDKSDHMIDPKTLCLEQEDGKQCKYEKRDHFLDDLELPQIEWPTVIYIPDPVGRDHHTVFKEGYSPADEDHSHDAPFLEPGMLFEFQVSIPCKGHKYIGEDKKAYSNERSFHKNGNDI